MRSLTKRNGCIGVAALCLLIAPLAPNAQADYTESVIFDQDEPYHVIDEIRGHVASGADMAGMRVTVTFTDGASEAVTWEATVDDSGQAVGTGWLLSQTGDTWNWYGKPWTLMNISAKAIREVELDGSPDDAPEEQLDTVFDRTWGGDPDPGTEGSEKGGNFEGCGALPDVAVVATYDEPVMLAEADVPVFDVYRFLRIRFMDDCGLGSGQTLQFLADTDVVPAPGAVVLGMIGLGMIGRVRKRFA